MRSRRRSRARATSSVATRRCAPGSRPSSPTARWTPQSLARSVSLSETEAIDPQTIKELVELWFTALDARADDVLVGMCDYHVLIRPYRARQEDMATEFRGHDGVREWVASLEQDTRIVLELIDIQITGAQCAVVEADVFFERAGTRSGGLTVSVWRFDDGKLCEAIGYGNRKDALIHAHSSSEAFETLSHTAAAERRAPS